MKLENKVVVITGASSGIGKELAFQLSQKNNTVVLASRNSHQLQEIEKSIRSHSGRALAVPTDVSKRAQVEQLMKTAYERFGRLDILINNAGISKAVGPLMDNKEEDVRETFEVNFMGSVYGVWAAVPYIEKTGGGEIVFVSSVVGKRAVSGSSSYCASKYAIQGLTESIRMELAPRNIRVITVCPPGVDTPFFVNNGRGDRPRFRLHPVEKIAKMIIVACEKEQREALLTIDSKLLHYGNVFFPRFMDWAIAKAKKVGGQRNG